MKTTGTIDQYRDMRKRLQDPPVTVVPPVEIAVPSTLDTWWESLEERGRIWLAQVWHHLSGSRGETPALHDVLLRGIFDHPERTWLGLDTAEKAYLYRAWVKAGGHYQIDWSPLASQLAQQARPSVLRPFIAHASEAERRSFMSHLAYLWRTHLKGQSPFEIGFRLIPGREPSFGHAQRRPERNGAVVKVRTPPWLRGLLAPRSYSMEAETLHYVLDLAAQPGVEHLRDILDSAALDALMELFVAEPAVENIARGSSSPFFYAWLSPNILDLWLRFWAPIAERLRQQEEADLRRVFRIPRIEGDMKLRAMQSKESEVRRIVPWARPPEEWQERGLPVTTTVGAQPVLWGKPPAPTAASGPPQYLALRESLRTPPPWTASVQQIPGGPFGSTWRHGVIPPMYEPDRFFGEARRLANDRWAPRPSYEDGIRMVKAFLAQFSFRQQVSLVSSAFWLRWPVAHQVVALRDEDISNRGVGHPLAGYADRTIETGLPEGVAFVPWSVLAAVSGDLAQRLRRVIGPDSTSPSPCFRYVPDWELPVSVGEQFALSYLSVLHLLDEIATGAAVPLGQAAFYVQGVVNAGETLEYNAQVELPGFYCIVQALRDVSYGLRKVAEPDYELVAPLPGVAVAVDFFARGIWELARDAMRNRSHDADYPYRFLYQWVRYGISRMAFAK